KWEKSHFDWTNFWGAGHPLHFGPIFTTRNETGQSKQRPPLQAAFINVASEQHKGSLIESQGIKRLPELPYGKVSYSRILHPLLAFRHSYTD
ncbi:MAG: hypothetical protein WA899_22625, partial [Candidatus Sulfotelmatobacter sp.]